MKRYILNKSWAISAMSVVIGLLVLTGCPPKKALQIEEKAAEEVVDENLEELADAAAIKINQDWTEIPALATIHFDYDSASLSASGRETLKKNVAILKKLPSSVTIRVEGHCDDRGTVEYNIALGQKRANSVSSYYATSGLSKSRLHTISFGEERLVCSEVSENCWGRNRRAVTKVKNKETITVQSLDLQ